MIDKTRLGIPLFDERFGGVYRKRSVLCIGRQGSGKTVASLHFLMQSLKEGERGLMLSAWRAHDLAIVAEKMGFPLEEAIKNKQITLLEYADIMPTQESEKSLTLPPGSFMEFQDIIETNSIKRVVIDSVLPWVAIHQEEKISKHVYSFIQAIERMGVTALMTLPKPVSALAFSLKNRLEDQVPVVFTLDVDEKENRTLTLNKYLGDNKLPPPTAILISSGVGIIRAPQIVSSSAPRTSSAPYPTQSIRSPRPATTRYNLPYASPPPNAYAPPPPQAPYPSAHPSPGPRQINLSDTTRIPTPPIPYAPRMPTPHAVPPGPPPERHPAPPPNPNDPRPAVPPIAVPQPPEPPEKPLAKTQPIRFSNAFRGKPAE